MIRINYDVLGISVSVACAIHCAVFPLILSGLPMLGSGIFTHLAFELTMIAIATVIGLVALFHGYKKHHHRLLPACIFVTGILLLVSKHLSSAAEVYLLIAAIAMIISAHLLNYKLCRMTHHSQKHSCSHP